MMSVYLYAWATERTLAQMEGRPEKTAVMMHNRKPYRTKQQRAEARQNAFLCKDGAYRSSAPVSFHPAPRG